MEEKERETMEGTAHSAEPSTRSGNLREVAAFFFRLGWVAFGGPAARIAMMREEVVRKRRWVSEERFLDLLGLANVIPGPSSTELAIYLGYERAGLPGLALAGTLFILPAMFIVLVFAWAYTQFGTLPQVAWAFYGVKPVIIAIILQALIGLARTAFKTPMLVAIGLVAFGVELLTGNAVLVIFGSGILVALLLRGPHLWHTWRTHQAAVGPAVALFVSHRVPTLRTPGVRPVAHWLHLCYCLDLSLTAILLDPKTALRDEHLA